jgi:aryl carrier-like protein
MRFIDASEFGPMVNWMPDHLTDVVSWLREALDDDTIAADDNFLAVGGHSLMAMSLNAWLVQRGGVAIDLPDLFQKSIRDAVAGASSTH